MRRELERYESMRDFDRTPEPRGRVPRATRAPKAGCSFVVQKHDARRLHYDFRLEHDGVLWSWAVPKGPSLKPGDKRLAVQTEDHPLDYRDFEGSIPEGQYGGGPVIVWDRGTWKPLGDPAEGMKKGRLDFELDGEKISGRFVLVRTRGLEGSKKPCWLLIKRGDDRVSDVDVVTEMPASVLTGRTIDDVRAGVPAKAPSRRGNAKKRGARKSASARVRARRSKTSRALAPGASELPPFGSIGPELATLVKSVPAGGPWTYEIKYDGYRSMAWLDHGEVKIASRRGLDWTEKYRAIADALSRVRAKTAIFDGEIAYVLDDGRTSFQKLQNALGSRSAEEHSRLVYFIFDLLFYDGVDLRGEPLSVRRDYLKTILAGEGLPLKASGCIEHGRAFFEEACKAGLEGIIGKRSDRPYVSGRTTDWIKIKCQQRQELVIVGFTAPKGARTGIGALLLGLREGAKLKYAGKVGTGFSNETLKSLSRQLEPLVVEEPAIVDPPRMRDVTWVEPKLVGQVRFTDWTKDGVLRHPSFEGLRLDKPASEVRREVPRPTPRVTKRANAEAVMGIEVTHPERVMDEGTGLTKLDLVRYVAEVADAMLPFVARRPLMLIRCPGGTQASVIRQSDRRQGKKTSCFVQKHDGRGLQRMGLDKAIAGDEETLYLTRSSQIVELAKNNTVELHGWGATFPRWDRPDWMVFDLDPDEALPFRRVVDAAVELRGALRTLKLESWVKTTGGKGLHVVVPIARRYDWPTVRRASEQIAILMTRAAPDRYVAKMSKAARVGRTFIDYLRNGEGATAVLPYSARARPGLPVAMPIAWRDLASVDPRELTIVTVPKLLARRRRDPWEALLSTKQSLPRELVEASAKL